MLFLILCMKELLTIFPGVVSSHFRRLHLDHVDIHEVARLLVDILPDHDHLALIADLREHVVARFVAHLHHIYAHVAAPLARDRIDIGCGARGERVLAATFLIQVLTQTDLPKHQRRLRRMACKARPSVLSTFVLSIHNILHGSHGGKWRHLRRVLPDAGRDTCQLAL